MDAFASILAFNLMLAGLIVFVWWLLDVIGKWFMFVKMGEPGWKSIIPIYSDYIIFKNVWQSLYFFILIAVNIANAFLTCRRRDRQLSDYTAALCSICNCFS